MEKEYGSGLEKDLTILIVLLVLAAFVFVISATNLSLFWKMLIVSNLIFSIVAGLVAKDRKIGFTKVFLLSLLLSPLIGLIIGISSERVKDARYRERMMEIAEHNAEQNNAPGISIADQLFKLNEMRKEGVLTEEEFIRQKERLLRS